MAKPNIGITPKSIGNTGGNPGPGGTCALATETINNVTKSIFFPKPILLSLFYTHFFSDKITLLIW